jgi:hypothetical protein
MLTLTLLMLLASLAFATIQLAGTTRDAGLDAYATEIGASPTLKFFTGAQPANCTAAIGASGASTLDAATGAGAAAVLVEAIGATTFEDLVELGAEVSAEGAVVFGPLTSSARCVSTVATTGTTGRPRGTSYDLAVPPLEYTLDGRLDYALSGETTDAL